MTMNIAPPDDKKNAPRKHGGDPHKLPEAAEKAIAGPDFPSQQAAAVQARWLVEKATDTDLKRLFLALEYQDGLDLLARMRKNCEIAGQTLNSRLSHDDITAKCVTCGGGRKQGRQWALIRPFMDPLTRTPKNQYFCDIFCVATENQKTHGVHGVSDRGMLPSDNPPQAQGTRGGVDKPTVKQPNSEEVS